MSIELAAAAAAFLRERGVTLAEGLGEHELQRVEERFGFEFGPDHRALLQLAVPLGDRWVDWRDDADQDIRARLERPIDGVLFDVSNNAFWPRSWGVRPSSGAEAEQEARRHVRRWPKLIPIYGHRYMPAAPSIAGAPVFSVHQTDVIYYGANLLDYLHRELGPEPEESPPVTHPVPPWSELAMGYDNENL